MKPAITIIYIYIAALVSADSLPLVAAYNESKVDSLCSIIYDPGISYSSKLDMMGQYTSISLYSEYFEKLYPLFDNLLEESRMYSNKEGLFFCYNSLADLYLGVWDRDSADRYLDSAAVYADQVGNALDLALYHRIRAQYIQRYFPDRMPEAVSDYQKSLSYYDKAGTTGKEDEIAIILCNLTMDAFLRNDSAYVHKNILKIKELKDHHNSPIIEFYFMDAMASLNGVYYRTSFDDRFLDSTIYYTGRCLDLYEKRLLPKAFDYLGVDLYTMVAETMSMKKNADITVIDSLLSIAKEKNIDSVGMARVYQTKARTFFDRNMIDSAEVMALKAQEYLETGYKNNYYSLVKRNIDILRDIYSVKGDYKKAIEYDDLWTKKDEEMRANEIKELELQFEVDAKDSELKKLYSDRLYQENRHQMYILICALLCLTTSFLILLIRSMKRNLNGHIALIDAEREEAKLKLKLKEEQTVKMQLEKYEVLSDFHLKEMELIGKTKDLEQLYQHKEMLDKQVELFRQKVEAYEVSVDKEEQKNSDVQYVIIEDLRRLITKQMPGDSRYLENLENLENLKKSYIDTLCEKSKGNLSFSYLKYCICFAIGMGISDVAECFNIEQSSVHMIRYRLKKKFVLGNDDDLGLFLQEVVPD
ncbi:MAG: hypothetical protein LBG96_07320 [Tannerella sp.]|jgi:hypothetical protein|nr:hypothetical protein [Tannerella sp.]